MKSTPIEFRCQHCGRRLRIGRDKLGKRVACPRCQQKTEVVLEGESAADPTGQGPAIQFVRDDGLPATSAGTNATGAENEARTDQARTDGAGTDEAGPELTFQLAKPAVLALAVLVIALPFAGFGLGWLAGRAAPAVQASRSRQPAFLAGEVVDSKGAPDANAIVLLFSESRAPQSSDRLIVELLRPSAAPLEPTHPVVRQLRSFDADTTRTDIQGRFTLRAPDVGKYYLLALSTKQNSQASVIPRSDIAQLGRYVDRPADLIRNQRYRWERIEVKGDRYEHVVSLP